MRSVQDIETHGQKDIFEFPLNDAHRMQTGFPDTPGPKGIREGNIRPVGGQFLVDHRSFDNSPGLVQPGVEAVFENVGRLPEGFSLLRASPVSGT